MVRDHYLLLWENTMTVLGIAKRLAAAVGAFIVVLFVILFLLPKEYVDASMLPVPFVAVIGAWFSVGGPKHKF